jgi:hypothetical protein
LIRWRGVVQTGADAGLPWPDDWQRVTLVDIVDPDPEKSAGAMSRELYMECRDMEARKYGTRAARAAAAPVSSRRSATRRSSRIRTEGSDDDEEIRPPRRRRRTRVLESDDDPDDGQAEEGGDGDPTRALFGAGAEAEDPLAQLLRQRQEREEAEAVMRSRVEAEMARRMDTGVRPSDALVAWARGKRGREDDSAAASARKRAQGETGAGPSGAHSTDDESDDNEL